MIVPTYVSGDWFAVITDGAVALLPPSIGEGRLNQVWDSLRENVDLTHALTVLAKGGLVGLPPFAMVSVADGHVRGFLRGNVRLLTTTAAGTQEHSASQVATWAEVNVADVLTLTVAVPSDVIRGGRMGSLPALAAVVHASSVEVRLDSEPRAATAASGSTGVAEVTMRDDSYLEDLLAAHGRGELTVEDGASAARRREVSPRAAEELFDAVRAEDPPVARRALPTDEPALPPTQTVTGHAPTPPPPTPTPPPPPPPAPPAFRAPDVFSGEIAVVAFSPPEMTVVPVTEPEPLSASAQATASADLDDIYGNTVLSSSLVEIRRQMKNRDPGVVPGPFPVAPVPPRVHKIRMSSGLIVPLDRVVLIGRAPAATRVSARDLPRLVTVNSPNQDISRTHAQVHTDGEDVLVTDLNSTNGMLLSEPGQPQRRLRAGEPTPLSPEAMVDLGDGVTFTLERER